MLGGEVCGLGVRYGSLDDRLIDMNYFLICKIMGRLPPSRAQGAVRMPSHVF